MSARRDRLRAAAPAAARDLDSVTFDEVRRAAPRMSRAFARCAAAAAVLHAAVVAATVAEFLVVPWWTLYARALTAVRLVVLACVALHAGCCCGRVPVVAMYGPGAPGKTLRALRPAPVLAAWLALGYAELYCVRIPGIAVDAAAGLIPGSGQTLEAGLLRAAVGVAVAAEFHLALHLVYQRGVRQNVAENLLAARRRTPRGGRRV